MNTDSHGLKVGRVIPNAPLFHSFGGLWCVMLGVSTTLAPFNSFQQCSTRELARNHPPLASTVGINARRRALAARAAAGRAFDGLRAGTGGREVARCPSCQTLFAAGESRSFDLSARSRPFLAVIPPRVSMQGARPSQGGLCFFTPRRRDRSTQP